jgi:imidazolonepropionase
VSDRTVIVAGRLVTCEGEGLGAIDNAALVIEAGRIAWLGERAALPKPFAPTIDAQQCVITPGLVDAHTHAAYMGSRHGEYAVRMAGGDYEAIAKAGGGILASQRAIAAATEDEIVETLSARLARMASLGVTTCEVKSGYGLVPEEELKQLRAIARVAARSDRPRVVATYLGLHALPKDADRTAFVARVADEMVPRVARQGLASFVDAYVDRNAFQVEEARLLAERARSVGLGVRLHVGQFADVGGAELAASVGARSADHLENVSAAGAEALARADVTAVLLPIASFTLAQRPPDIAQLRRAGVAVAIASDANPGTAPSESLPLAMALGVRLYGLTIEEAILGATRIAAASLGAADRGRLYVGGPADLVVWDLPHEAAIVQPWGTPRARLVLRDGVTLARATSSTS